MPVICIGTDLVQISRIAKIQNRWQLRFAQKILTDNELHEFIVQFQHSSFLAKRFAAKEACMKALGTGCAEGIGFHQIEIKHNESGKPYLYLMGKAKEKAELMLAHNWLLTISDEKDYAIAFVLATV